MKRFFALLLLITALTLSACAPATTPQDTLPVTDGTEGSTESEYESEESTLEETSADTAESTDNETTEEISTARYEKAAELTLEADILIPMGDGKAFIAVKDGKYGVVLSDGTVVHEPTLVHIGICPYHGFTYGDGDMDYIMTEDYELTDEAHGGHGINPETSYLYRSVENGSFYQLTDDGMTLKKIDTIEKSAPFVEFSSEFYSGDGVDVLDIETGAWGMVSSDASVLVDPIYESIGNVGKYATAFYNGEKYAYFDYGGRKLTNFDFTHTRVTDPYGDGTMIYETDGWDNDHVAVRAAGKCGVIGIDGEYIVKPEFEEITPVDENGFYACKDGKWAYYRLVL